MRMRIFIIAQVSFPVSQRSAYRAFDLVSISKLEQLPEIKVCFLNGNRPDDDAMTMCKMYNGT
jgi:hypothetical protein